MLWLIIFVLVQLVVAAVVVIVLKRLLDKELIEAALEKLEFLKPTQGAAQLIIRSAADLDGRFQERFESLHRRKFAQLTFSFEQDKALKGGVVLVVGEDTLDFSLANRLRNFWL